MERFLLLQTVILFSGTVIAVIYYRQSTSKLLTLVRANEALWKKLGCPKRVLTGELDLTIQPLFPWLGWVLEGNTSGLSSEVAIRLQTTRTSLLIGLLLMSLTGLTIAGLVFSSS